MNANLDLERRLADHFATEALQRAPDEVLAAVLGTTVSTPQRRPLFGVPWRFPIMNSYAKLAVAAVAVIAVGAVGLAVLRPGLIPDTGGPVVTPSASPTAAPSQVPWEPPELTQTFTSDVNGFSLSYPTGWLNQAATASWTMSGPPLFREPIADFLYDPARTDHLFLSVASQDVDDAAFGQWATDLLPGIGCGTSTEPIVVDGFDGVVGTECSVALVSAGGRGYMVLLYTSADDSLFQRFDSSAWLEKVLATMQLEPQDAVDVAPSPSP